MTGPAKIFTSANKIFALSKYHPVALMVFDNAQFHGIPWETIVKQYRRELKDESFPTLSDHAQHFLSYFDTAKELFPPESQRRGVSVLVYTLFEAILADALRMVERRMAEGAEPTGKEVVDEIEQSIDWHHARWKDADTRKPLPGNYAQTVRKEYAEQVDEELDSVFEEVPLSASAKRKLRQLLPWVATKDLPFERLPTHSGIVIAGFGDQDVFPRLRRFAFEAVIANHLKYVEGDPIDVGPGNRAVIVPFAQSEQVETFMEGMDRKLGGHLHQWWHEKLNSLVTEIGAHLQLSDKDQADLENAFRDRCIEIVGKDYDGEVDDFSWKNHVEPIIDIVGMLPKDELAEMAESLVNLTSFKRRVTPQAETVGGPIDVAVISRGDGFIWIKRKHYFKTELNPHFLSNYYRH